MAIAVVKSSSIKVGDAIDDNVVEEDKILFIASNILWGDEEGMEREWLSVFEPDDDSALYEATENRGYRYDHIDQQELWVIQA